MLLTYANNWGILWMSIPSITFTVDRNQSTTSTNSKGGSHAIQRWNRARRQWSKNDGNRKERATRRSCGRSRRVLRMSQLRRTHPSHHRCALHIRFLPEMQYQNASGSVISQETYKRESTRFGSENRRPCGRFFSHITSLIFVSFL